MKHNLLFKTLQNLTNRKIKQREIAEILGFPVNTISNRAVRDSEYSLEEILKINKALKVNLPTNELVPNVEIVSDEEFIEVDYYPEVFGSCGSGTFVLSETTEKMPIPKRFLPYNNIKKYSIINAYGDSMSPTIFDKDKLIIEHTEDEAIVDNRVYVFRFGDNIFIKRLVVNINQLVIKSDNTEYDTIKLDIPNDNVQLIGKVVGLVRDMK